MLHAILENWLYFSVKIPLYGYEGQHEGKLALQHYSRRYKGATAKIRRILFGKR